MKFEITRTSLCAKPHPAAIREQVTVTESVSKDSHATVDFMKYGFNHRESADKSKIEREIAKNLWTTDLVSIDDLLNFIRDSGEDEVVIDVSTTPPQIEIYDEYRE